MQLRWKLIHHSTSAALLLAPPVKQMIGSLYVCVIPCAHLPLAHPPHDAFCAHAPLDRAGSFTPPPWSDSDETCCCRCRFTPAAHTGWCRRISHEHWSASASSEVQRVRSGARIWLYCSGYQPQLAKTSRARVSSLWARWLASSVVLKAAWTSSESGSGSA